MKRIGTMVIDVVIIGGTSLLTAPFILALLVGDASTKDVDLTILSTVLWVSITVTSIIGVLVTIGRSSRLEERERELELVHKLIQDIGGDTVHATLKRRALDVQEAYVAYDKERKSQSSADEPHPESDAIKNLRDEHDVLLKRFNERRESARLAGIPVYRTIADTLSNESLGRDSPPTAEKPDTDASSEATAEAARA